MTLFSLLLFLYYCYFVAPPSQKLETHPDVVAIIKQLREERDKKLALLHQWRENQIQSIEDAAYAERKECEEEYEVCF
jgi:hypothetical protein